MARIVLTERPDSRKWTVGDSPSFELRYNATGDSNPTRIRDQALAIIPIWWEGLSRTEISIDPDPIMIDSVTGRGLWLVVASYKMPVINGVKQVFDTTGGTFHISQSISTRDKYALAGKAATDHQGAINADGERVEGIDITVPVYTFSETYEVSPYVMTPSYRGTLFHLTGKINTYGFRGFRPFEVHRY